MRFERWLYTVPLRLRSLFRRNRVEDELDEELRYHLERQIEENIAIGMTKDEARYAALRTFVGLEQRKEECRDMRRVRFIEDIWQDLHYGVRILRKNPGFTAVATLTLALGIGANTAIFSVVDAVLFRPLPFEASDRLLMVAMANPQLGESRLPFSVADFLDWQEQNQVFDDLAAFTDNWLSLTGNAEPERVRGAYVTAGFFTTLRAQALMGRTFAAGDDAPGRDSLVVLSHQLWQRRFNSDPQVVGQAVTLSGRSRTIIGVMQDSFQFPPDDKTSLPGKVDLWVPHTLNPPARRGPYYLWGIARLRPGTTPENAQAELESIGLRIRDANPLTNAATTFVAVSLKDAMVGDVRRVLLVLLGAVAFVLLIASTNVANLSLARAAARQREIAIRTALGARRARITRQLLTESLLLAGLGAALGFALAFWLTHLLTTLGPGSLPRLAEVKIDYRVFGYTGAVTVLSGMLFGMAPAWHGSRTNLNESLKEGSRNTAESRGWQRTRSLLVIGELALSLVLLVGAGLMLNSLLRLQRVSPGFEPLNILTMEINLPSVRYKEEHQINGFYHELLERAGSLPGVQSAGIGMSLPPNLLSISDSFTIEGAPATPGTTAPAVPLVVVSSGYFSALGVPLIAGRNFDETDSADKPQVAIINETLARRYFPSVNPLGRRIKVGGPERPTNPWMEIVGIVGDVAYGGLEAAPEATFYQNYLQLPWSSNYLVVRSPSDPRPLTAAIRNTIWTLDKDLPVAGVKTMEQLLAESIAQPRFRTFIFVVFGALALALSLTGVYGVMSYLVTQRTREIGIRMALGAERRDVLKLVIRQGVSLAFLGILIGLPMAFGMTRLMIGLLFAVTATDPVTYSIIALILIVVAVLACWIPAHRAVRVNPVEALRYE